MDVHWIPHGKICMDLTITSRTNLTFFFPYLSICYLSTHVIPHLNKEDYGIDKYWYHSGTYLFMLKNNTLLCPRTTVSTVVVLPIAPSCPSETVKLQPNCSGVILTLIKIFNRQGLTFL